MEIGEKGVIVSRLQEKTLNISKMLINLQQYSEAFKREETNEGCREWLEKETYDDDREIEHKINRCKSEDYTPKKKSTPSSLTSHDNIPLLLSEQPDFDYESTSNEATSPSDARLIDGANTGSSEC